MAGQREEGFTKRPTSLSEKISAWLKGEGDELTPQQARRSISKKKKGVGGAFEGFVTGIDSFLAKLGL